MHCLTGDSEKEIHRNALTFNAECSGVLDPLAGMTPNYLECNRGLILQTWHTHFFHTISNRWKACGSKGRTLPYIDEKCVKKVTTDAHITVAKA